MSVPHGLGEEVDAFRVQGFAHEDDLGVGDQADGGVVQQGLEVGCAEFADHGDDVDFAGVEGLDPGEARVEHLTGVSGRVVGWCEVAMIGCAGIER